MKRIWLTAVLAGLGTSCAREAARAKAPVPNPVRQTLGKHVENALDAGDGDIESTGLRQAVVANPKDFRSRTALAQRYAKLGFPELAVEHYRLAATLEPDDPAVQIELARQLRANGMNAEAARLLDAFLAARDGVFSEVHAWAGIVHDEAGELAVGETEHRKAIAAAETPEDSLHNNLGYNLLLQGRSPEAQAEFRKALELSPRSEIARNNLGMALGAGSPDSVAHWQSVLGPSAAHNNMAAALIEQSRYPEARKELNIALGYKPDNSAALHNLALVSRLDGQPAVLPFSRPPGSWKGLGWIFKGGRRDSRQAAPVRAAR